MALALSAGSVYANTCTASVDTNLPILCSGTTSDNQSIQSNILGWNATQAELPSSAYMPTLHNGGASVLEKLTFKFMDSSGTSGTITQGASSGQEATLKAGNDKTATFVTLKGNTKGIQMGASGSGTLVIDFGNGADVQRNFTLDLSNTAQGDFSFKGNLEVRAGKGNPSEGDTQNSQFVATFSKNVEGDIHLVYNGQGNAAGHKNTLTFEDGSNLKGNLNATAGTNTITFKNGNVEGSVIAGSAYGSFGTALNKITFEGADNKITKGVKATDSAWGAGRNEITFKNGGSITSETTSGDAIYAKSSGKNLIVFEGNNNSILGNITATIPFTKNGGTNIITFDNTKQSLRTDSNHTIQGNISATGNATNSITFNTAGNNSITGNITSNTSAYGGSGNNTIVFNYQAQELRKQTSNSITGDISVSGNSTNTITFSSVGDNSITGKILATTSGGGGHGINTISFLGSDSNSITGDLVAVAGSNIVNFTNSGTNKITGNISSSASSGGGHGVNTITFENDSGSNGIYGDISSNAGTITITSNGTSSNTTIIGNIQVSGGATATNTITLQSQGTNRIIGNIMTNGNNNGEKSNNILITGKSNSANLSNLNTDTLSFFAGNITTSTGNGGTNIIFEDSLWLPSNLKELKLNQKLVGPDDVLLTLPESGTLTNSSGTTNLVLKQSMSYFGNLDQDKLPIYNITNSGGSVNIVMQGPLNVGANIDYNGNGTTTLIFANSNDGGEGNFSHPLDPSSTDVSDTNSKVLGVNYQDGVKLKLKDKNIKIGDKESVSFIQEYSKYFSGIAENGLLTLTTDRKNTSSGSTNTQTDTITIKGLALGDISELGSS
ncbi:hypothetical protein LW138_06660, partial [Helicobacter sp. faydin-H17]|uniref:beta strand repeat-containing protein n=1 Tax=Helicobacter kayseriensis TaxID=2905877 RepID=UPI001E2EB522